VDIDAVGLGDMAKREDYVGRQLRRWKRQWDQSNHTDIALVDEVHARLVGVVPEQRRSSIVHGDFRLGNMMCGPDGRIRAVLDWELATLGDPLADVAWLVASWVEPGEWPATGTDGAPPSILPGFPGRGWLLDRYAAGTGADLGAMPVYLAFNHWRAACIAAGVLTRYESGAMADDSFDRVAGRRSIIDRASQAMALLDGDGE